MKLFFYWSIWSAWFIVLNYFIQNMKFIFVEIISKNGIYLDITNPILYDEVLNVKPDLVINLLL